MQSTAARGCAPTRTARIRGITRKRVVEWLKCFPRRGSSTGSRVGSKRSALDYELEFVRLDLLRSGRRCRWRRSDSERDRAVVDGNAEETIVRSCLGGASGAMGRLHRPNTRPRRALTTIMLAPCIAGRAIPGRSLSPDRRVRFFIRRSDSWPINRLQLISDYA